MAWSGIQGVLCDITGVLAESSSQGDGTPVPGSIEAVNRLVRAGVRVKFVTNESQRTRDSLHGKLTRLGFSINKEDILTPALAMSGIAKKQGLRPFLLVHPSVLDDLGNDLKYNEEEADCVVLGDAVEGFNYHNMNKAFKVLDRSSSHQLYCLGKGKCYKEDGERILDVGPFAAALEFATERPAVVVGKPGNDFFQSGLSGLELSEDEVVMVGDDLVSDVGGAQKSGIRGVLVRTGKFRLEDENHPVVKPDLVVDNLKGLVDIILVGRE